MESREVRLNEDKNRFEVDLDGQLSLLEFRRSGTSIVFPHTEVPRALEGQGIASQLTKAALAYAREQKLQVIPACSFVATYMKRHKETQDLLHPDHKF